MSSPYSGPDWPAHFTTNQVYGKFVNADGTPTVGKIGFTPRPTALVVTNDATVVVPTAIEIELDDTGSFNAPLPVTDDPNVRPIKWTYAVSEGWSGGRPTYDIAVPTGAALNLLDLAPAPSTPGVMSLVGPPGPPGNLAFSATEPLSYNGSGVLSIAVGTAANTVAAGNDTRLVGALQGANNLSDIADAATARINLGITGTGGGGGGTSLTDNGDGTWTDISDTLVDNGNGTWTG